MSECRYDCAGGDDSASSQGQDCCATSVFPLSATDAVVNNGRFRSDSLPGALRPELLAAPSFVSCVQRIRRPNTALNKRVGVLPRADGGAMSGQCAESAKLQCRILAMLIEAGVPLNAEALLEGLWAEWFDEEHARLNSKEEGPLPSRIGLKRERCPRATVLLAFPDPKGFPLTEASIISHLSALKHQGRVKSFKGNTFYAVDIPRAIIVTNLLVSPDYQRLGLEAWSIAGSSFHIVPPNAEHRFLCFRASNIPGAGLGLFLRPHRMLRAGTIVCEYKGRSMKRNSNQSSHAVRLQSGLVIDGLDVEGNVMSFAPLMNDNGPVESNVKLTEFDEFPERVFVAAKRDLFGGEELFVEYGANYWGKKSYSEVRVSARSASVSRPTSAAMADAIACSPFPASDLISSSASVLNFCHTERYCSRCRDCSSYIPRRVMSLHVSACEDSLTSFVPLAIDPLPFNFFTSSAHSFSSNQIRHHIVSEIGIGGTPASVPCSLSTSFVHSTPLTFSLTHEICNPTALNLTATACGELA